MDTAEYERAWRELAEGVVNRKHGFHTFTLATVGADGFPTARTVVLREADAATRILRFHGDARSPKFDELRGRPQVCALFYGETERFQVRVSGTATVHHGDDLCRTIWDAMQPISRETYRTPFAPTSPREESDSDAALLALPDAFQHFAVCRIAVTTLEWLALSRGINPRARHDFDTDGAMRTHFLHP
ncbi:MAG: pyridoxamine 5'-phosphate oxidase family protein [Armatimonadetes bacterium]|nr:pyridoxamine 5'-phosphate oxidase family protein [Armatimonadota bacterium]